MQAARLSENHQG